MRILFLVVLLFLTGTASVYANDLICDSMLSPQMKHLHNEMLVRGYAVENVPQFLNSSAIRRYFETLPKGWKINLQGRATPITDETSPIGTMLFPSKERIQSIFGVSSQSELRDRTFNPIETYIAWLTEMVTNALPDENLELSLAEVRTVSASQTRSYGRVGEYHDDEAYLSVTLALIGDGSIIKRKTKVLRVPGQKAVFISGKERPYTAATFHKEPKIVGDRLLILLRFRPKNFKLP